MKDFNQLTAEAAAGKLSKEEFVTKVVECEDIAAEKARAFYIHAFLPWAKDHQVSTRPETWYIPSRSHLGENARSRSIDKNGPYWQHYQLSYDLIIMDLWWMTANMKKPSSWPPSSWRTRPQSRTGLRSTAPAALPMEGTVTRTRPLLTSPRPYDSIRKTAKPTAAAGTRGPPRVTMEKPLPISPRPNGWSQ